MYFRRLFSDNKNTSLLEWTEPGVFILPVNDGSNRKAYKTYLKLSVNAQKTQTGQGRQQILQNGSSKDLINKE